MAKTKATKRTPDKKKPEKKPEAESGEQSELFDFHPENHKEIVTAAKLYKQFQAERLAADKKEAEQKALILELVKKAELQTLAGGKIRFRCDDVIISITPRDELVQVKEEVTKG